MNNAAFTSAVLVPSPFVAADGGACCVPFAREEEDASSSLFVAARDRSGEDTLCFIDRASDEVEFNDGG